MAIPESRSITIRIQGTDGIRREVASAASPGLAGLSPQRAFFEKGVITEEFMELYAYAHVVSLKRKGEVKRGDAFVVGWDPRDPAGIWTEAVVRGVRKAGADALVLGVAPTPLVPLYLLYRRAAGGFMVTASHNPKDQNGIKTFLAFRGMKLLPENDVQLTRTLMGLPSIRRKPLRGKRKDCAAEARRLFMEFSLDPDNSWAHGVSFKNIHLVVDPARGSLTTLAAEVFRLAGFGKVVEVNNRLDGNVNLRSGVADLEGHRVVNADEIAKGSGHFARHRAVLKLFELGRRERRRIQQGDLQVCGAVFDADGDRFYRLDYDPFHDRLWVLSGDETACLQARFLRRRDPARYAGAVCINTVESDLNAGQAMTEMGFQHQLTAVGDKWILLRIAGLIAGARIRQMKGPAAARAARTLKSLQRTGVLDMDRFRALEAGLDRQVPASGDGGELRIPFAVGSEETGHNITLGRLRLEDGTHMPVFFGNGLKSALNTFAAGQTLLSRCSPKTRLTRLARPFPPGYKATHYAYYVKKEQFYQDSPVWRKVKRLALAEAKQHGYRCRSVRFPEDPDMLYLALSGKEGSRAGVFVRNSGTENKIGVNLRGGRRDAAALKRIGEAVARLLLEEMKDMEHRLYKVELDLLSRIAGRPLPETSLQMQDERRVMHEMVKQNLVRPTPAGFRLTPRGKWYITH